jgi:hypothetical protein
MKEKYKNLCMLFRYFIHIGLKISVYKILVQRPNVFACNDLIYLLLKFLQLFKSYAILLSIIDIKDSNCLYRNLPTALILLPVFLERYNKNCA